MPETHYSVLYVPANGPKEILKAICCKTSQGQIGLLRDLPCNEEGWKGARSDGVIELPQLVLLDPKGISRILILCDLRMISLGGKAWGRVEAMVDKGDLLRAGLFYEFPQMWLEVARQCHAEYGYVIADTVSYGDTQRMLRQMPNFELQAVLHGIPAQLYAMNIFKRSLLSRFPQLEFRNQELAGLVLRIAETDDLVLYCMREPEGSSEALGINLAWRNELTNNRKNPS